MPKRHAARAMTTCPRCGEETSARWRQVPAPEGYSPIWRLFHRKRSGARCEAFRGAAIGYWGSRARAHDGMLDDDSRSVRCPEQRHGSE